MYGEEIRGQGRDLEDVGIYVVRQGDVDDRLHELPHVVLLKQLGDPGALRVPFDGQDLAVRPHLVSRFHHGERLYDAFFGGLLVCIEALICGHMNADGLVDEILGVRMSTSNEG